MDHNMMMNHSDTMHNMENHDSMHMDDSHGMMDMNHTMDHNMMMHSMMMMYFHFTKNIPHLLFRQWSIDSEAELFGAIVFGLVLAILYEGLKTVKDHITKRMNAISLRVEWKVDSEKSLKKSSPYSRRVKLWVMRLVVSLLRTVEVGMAYILMLLAMTYNGWLFLSVTVGAGIGLLIFLPFRPSGPPSDDHCG